MAGFNERSWGGTGYLPQIEPRLGTEDHPTLEPIPQNFGQMAGQIGGGMLRGVANTGEAWSQIAQVLANLAAFVPGMKPGATAGIGFPGGPPRPGLVPVR